VRAENADPAMAISLAAISAENRIAGSSLITGENPPDVNMRIIRDTLLFSRFAFPYRILYIVYISDTCMVEHATRPQFGLFREANMEQDVA
jgi:hypothetical protein